MRLHYLEVIGYIKINQLIHSNEIITVSAYLHLYIDIKLPKFTLKNVFKSINMIETLIKYYTYTIMFNCSAY